LEAPIISNAPPAADILRRAVTRGIFDGLTVLDERADAAGWRARLRVEPSSRAFAGHFEGDPVLPGVAQLVIVGHALGVLGQGRRRMLELPAVRFRRVVRPGEVLEVSVSAPDVEGASRFEVRVGDAVAASGTLRSGGVG
jgi:3-hydroxyacyl-[acyl-carrier-protein] dehydratase